MSKYRQLKKGELIQEGDEIDASVDGWRDEAKWIKAKYTRGTEAPDPCFPAHRLYRRKI